MHVEKFRGRTIKEAIGKVKETFGPEAMIISTKKLGGNGTGPQFEITAVPSNTGDFAESPGFLAEVKSELMSIKEMIYILNHTNGALEKLIWNPSLLNIYARLIRNGVRRDYAMSFLEKSGVLRDESTGAKVEIVKRTIRAIKHAIKTKDPFAAKGNGQIIAAFIGTTGVGKTTTIAKIAAQLVLGSKKKVGLISIDNYRIGAAEQIKTYAHILGIPCFPAFNRKDLFFALRRMEGRDVVLIDTAGQSQYDMSRIIELRQMIPGELSISSHLLLSVATSEPEMHRTAVNFGPFEFESYIFTKLDETQQFGSIINQIMKLNLPISYFTTGQNVPDDIERARKEKLLSLILNKN
ncbi:MAG: protein FlhF [Deltaproteobacteria bacterium]|nr:protein FlhF [Deltaproteobacteria bacterium]